MAKGLALFVFTIMAMGVIGLTAAYSMMPRRKPKNIATFTGGVLDGSTHHMYSLPDHYYAANREGSYDVYDNTGLGVYVYQGSLPRNNVLEYRG